MSSGASTRIILSHRSSRFASKDKKIHVDPVEFASIKSHISDSKTHIDTNSFNELKSNLSNHSQNKNIHVDSAVVDNIKSSLDSHSKDKKIHVDPVEFASIKSHISDLKTHVDPVTMSQIKSHTDNSKIHFNESTLKKLDEHLSNNKIHIDPSILSNPFYYIGSYTGNGSEEQLIKLPFSPSFVIVFASKLSPVMLTTVSKETVITFACCSKTGASPGLTPSPEGFIAQTTKVYQQNKIAKHLNTSGATYHYIAFR